MFYSVFHDYDYCGAYHHEVIETSNSLDEMMKLFNELVKSSHEEFDGDEDPLGEKVDSMESYWVVSHEDEEECDYVIEWIDSDVIFDNTTDDD